jgi:hypothetical protein
VPSVSGGLVGKAARKGNKKLSKVPSSHM